MQQPTCTNVRIRSTNDAHKIFAAVQNGVLHMVSRRLDADERLALRSGCIYAWEERGPHSELTGLGIERFTEGRRWSPSRVRDEFLFYYEKYSPPPDANHTLTGSSSDRQQQPPRDWDPLVKQTYSVYVQTDKGRRKWHLTAYFTQTTIDQLGCIDDNPQLRDIVVEEGMFKSTRVGKSRSKADDNGRSDGGSKSSTSLNRTYAPFPTPYQYQQQNDSASATPVLMHEPYQTQRLDSSPAYNEQNPSPASTLSQVDRGSYSGNGTQGNVGPYMSHGYAISSNTMSSANSNSAHLSNYPVQPSLHNAAPSNAYYSPPPSHSSWDGSGNAAYYTRADHHQHLTGPPGARSLSLLSSPNYSRPSSNQAPASPHLPYPAHFPPANVHGANPAFSPPYSLHTALALPGNEAGMSGDMLGAPLSPLHITDRVHSSAGSSHGSLPYSHMPQISMETGDVSMDAAGNEEGISENGLLAPLSLLRPPVVRYVRDRQDEKALRRLRERNSNA